MTDAHSTPLDLLELHEWLEALPPDHPDHRPKPDGADGGAVEIFLVSSDVDPPILPAAPTDPRAGQPAPSTPETPLPHPRLTIDNSEDIGQED